MWSGSFQCLQDDVGDESQTQVFQCRDFSVDCCSGWRLLSLVIGKVELDLSVQGWNCVNFVRYDFLSQWLRCRQDATY